MICRIPPPPPAPRNKKRAERVVCFDTARQALAVDQIMWTKCAEDALNLVEKGDPQALLSRCTRDGEGTETCRNAGETGEVWQEAMRANIRFTNQQLEPMPQ